MKWALAVLVLVAVLATRASGAPPIQTSASTNSFLVSTFSDLAASRTISESSVTSPILNYNSNGQVDSYVIQPGGGGAVISQNVYSSANYYNGLGGMTSFSSDVTATNAKGSNMVMTGKSTAEVCYNEDYAMIQSQTFGMGVAKAGEGEYSFEVSGDQKTVSTILPAAVPVLIYPDDRMDKELIVTFTQNPLDMVEPADILHVEVDFNYGTMYNQPTFYNYDYSSFLSFGDTSCNSYMIFSHVN